LNSESVYLDYIENKIDRSSAVNLLVTFIENSKNLPLVLNSIQKLDKIGVTENEVYDLLENLVISDINKKIRTAAAITLKNNYRDHALIPLLWSIQTNSTDIYFQDEIIQVIFDVLKHLKTKTDKKTAILLFKGVKEIINKGYAEKIAEMVKDKKEKNESWTILELVEVLEKYVFYIYSQAII